MSSSLVVALFPLILVRIREGDGLGIVEEAASLAEADATSEARRAADCPVGDDSRADEGKNWWN